MTLRLNGDNSGFTEIKAADAAGDNSIKLPASNGSANQLLKNGGTAGELQYTSNLQHTTTGALLLSGPSVRTNLFKTFSASLQIEGVGGTGLDRAGIAVIENCSSEDPAYTVLARSSGPGLGANTALTSANQWVGVHSFQGHDGTRFLETAQIKSYTDGVPGTNVMPGNLVFSTNGGGENATDRIEIDKTGALRLLTGCPGIDFSTISSTALAGTIQSNLLDDYEEGTFTPTLYGGVTAGTFTPTGQNGGMYTKIGNIVYCMINVQGTISGAAGQPRVGGLPFTSAAGGTTQAGNATYSTGSLQYWNQSGADFMGPLNQAGTSYIYFHDYDGDSSGSAQINNAVGHNLHCCVAYRVA